ncbi:MAG: hypothetical protein JSU62_02840 [Gammaproteobacteria bacterium]|nr:MAG: hypothetical protein JSU62_02840 [Gammaproteobacteria bacterium]
MPAIRAGLYGKINWPPEANGQDTEVCAFLLITGVAQRNSVTWRHADCLQPALRGIQQLRAGTDAAQLDDNLFTVRVGRMVDVLHREGEIDAYLGRCLALVDFNAVDRIRYRMGAV